MLELALIHSETSFPEFLELWIRSLPPNERSRYVAMLYNEAQFPNIPWDYHFYKYSLQDRRAVYDGTTTTTGQKQQQHQRPDRMPTPPKPLGDDRHSRKNNSIRNAAYFFYEVLSHGCLFEGGSDDSSVDCNGPLNARYVELIEPDILETIGPVFGIQKSELVFGRRSDVDDLGARNQPSWLSPSERILRCWNILHRARRLCKTELEDALVRGPVGVRDLLERGVTLIRMTLGDDPEDPAVLMTDGVEELLFSSNQVEFVELTTSQPMLEECDYCGRNVPKRTHCSKCKVALYCSRECQTKDWRRHKWLCHRYCYPPKTTTTTTTTTTATAYDLK
jgi:hypothetical protein